MLMQEYQSKRQKASKLKNNQISFQLVKYM